MKKNKSIILILSLAFVMLPFWGCSDSDNESIDPETTTNNVGNEFVIYEANLRIFAQNGSINAIADRLENIKALGTNVLWIMPFYEQGVIKSVGSPYCIKDY